VRRWPRVALVFGSFPPARNGGADFLGRFAAALADAGADVHVLTSAGSRADREQVGPGVTVHRAIRDWSARGARGARLVLAETDVDVAHVFFPDSELGARYVLPALLPGPLVTTFWNLGLGRRSPASVRLTAAALLGRSSALTSHDARYLGALRRVALGRAVAWLPVGNNLGLGGGASAGADGSTLAYFGQVDFTRGLEDLFEAVRLVRARRDVRLVLVGSAGREERYETDAATADYYRRLRGLPAELGIADAVEWTGYLADEEAAARLAGAAVCVLPYRRNSLGRSALAAALELGVPTILAGAAADVAPLEDGRDVVLVPREDAAALAAAIERVLDAPGERARLAAGARRAGRLFAWPRLASGALALYRRVLACA
jgi:glycosyltransferase involved in cell wall biosynthesis